MAQRQDNSYSHIVIGGGISGAAIAYGLVRQGCKTAMLDTAPGQTGMNKASRGNMGLIWCQSKFAHLPDYARWGFTASRLYPEFVRELEEISGLPTKFVPSGGLIPCLGEADYTRRETYLGELRRTVDPDYQANMLSRSELEKMLPRIAFGSEVTGAVWCPADGYIDPLRLLYATRKAFSSLGGTFLPDSPMLSCAPCPDGGYVVTTPQKTLYAQKIVLAAGLSNIKLMQIFNAKLPVFPDRSQVFLTERIDDVLPIPLLGITRTPGGTVMIGFMHEKAGLDTQVDPNIIINEGHWALRVWPDLGKLRIIRSWSSLRIMPDDAQAIYDVLDDYPNVYVISTHSAVTLASAHALLLAPWIAGTQIIPQGAESFSLRRFSSHSLEAGA